MNEIFLELIKQLNSSVFVLLLLLIVAGYILYKLGTWAQKWTDHDKRVEKIEGLSEKVVALITKVDLIYQNTNPRSLVASHSPISLTDLGREMKESIDGDKIFQHHEEALLKLLDQRKPSNAYDIQTESLNIALQEMPKLLNEEELSRVKDEAYKKGIIIEDIMRIFGILLRNKVLGMKNISISDVDKHAPKRD